MIAEAHLFPELLLILSLLDHPVLTAGGGFVAQRTHASGFGNTLTFFQSAHQIYWETSA